MEVEYVYALHDFEPQNDDEISFIAGERIEVLERDDAYGDGWWTGRNLAGQEGIFPKDYTTPAGPLIPDLRTPTNSASFPSSHSAQSTNGYYGHSSYPSTLHPLTEEPESDTALNGPSQASSQQLSNQPSQPGAGAGVSKGGGQLMASTMTDIQHAIDALGHRNRANTDDISFVSTKDDRTSITDRQSIRESMYDDGDLDNELLTPGGKRERTTMNEDWHRDARRRLFERVAEQDAKRRLEEGEEETEDERLHHHHGPVEVEFSDESEDEDGHHHHHHHDPPNDLLSRLQTNKQQHPKHEDSIPSTLPSTFQDHSTTSLPFGKQDEVAVSSSASGNGAQGAESESPARADDSPIYSAHPQNRSTNASASHLPVNQSSSHLADNKSSSSTYLPEHQEEEKIKTPVQVPKPLDPKPPEVTDRLAKLFEPKPSQSNVEAPPVYEGDPLYPVEKESKFPSAAEEKAKFQQRLKEEEGQFLPAPGVGSPFAPSPFSVNMSPPLSAVNNANYPITSSALYPSPGPGETTHSSITPVTEPQEAKQSIEAQFKAAEERAKGMKAIGGNTAASSSYVSFLPSPTTTSFNTAPSASNSGGISQTLAQSQSQPVHQAPQSTQYQTQQPAQQQHQPPSFTDQSNMSASNISNIPSIQAVDSFSTPNGNPPSVSHINTTSLAPPSLSSTQASPQSTPAKSKRIPPAEWTVDQVVDWIRSKGFDEGIASKFREHEISGDVLLEFDANMLKEIDIVAFGKRMKIANAINELRRPPSFDSEMDGNSLMGAAKSFSGYSVGTPGTGTTGLGTSIGPSTLSSPPQSGTAAYFSGAQGSMSMPHIGMGASPIVGMGQFGHGHTMSQSTQGGYNASISSAGVPSPNVFGMFGQQQSLPQQNSSQPPGQAPAFPVPRNQEGPQSPPMYAMVSPGGNMYTGEFPPTSGTESRGSHVRVDSDPGINVLGDAARMMAAHGMGGLDRAATVGYSGMKGKNRPSSLALTPSEGNLSQMNAIPVVPEEDDRAALSDSDLRKRKEILSLDTTRSHEPPDTPGSRSDTPSRASLRPRSSIDTKPSDRLSFFSAMARNRKPAPSDQSGSELGSPNMSQQEKQKTYSKLYLAGPTRPPRVGKTKEEKEKEKRDKADAAKAKRDSKDKDKEKEVVKDVGGVGGVLRKRTLSGEDRRPVAQSTNTSTSVGGKQISASGAVTLKPGEDVLKQLMEIVGEPDHSGFMLKKGERYNTWKNRFFFLKGPHLYYLRSKHETRIKGYINIRGYKVIADEATAPGKYGFRIVHDTQKPHFFSSEEQSTIREWMKALMKATIDRDYTRPIISSANIPTIPLAVAQAMNPAPRPPSPTSAAAAQRASRTGDAGGLSSRDAKVLMGMAEGSAMLGQLPTSLAPARPSREMRRPSLANRTDGPKGGSNAQLIQWINSLLPDQTPYATDLSSSLSSGLILFRLGESIKHGQQFASTRLREPSPDDPIVPDSLFEDGEERIDGLMKLFDFLLDNDVKLQGISMADIREGRSEKIIALVKSMKQWKEDRDAIAKSVGVGGQAGVMTWIHG